MSQNEEKPLGQRIAEALRGLEMLSHGSTQAWNASGGGGSDPSARMVTLVLRRDDPPHITYRIRYERARTEHSRRIVVEAAEQELNEWRKREKLPEASIDEDTIVIADYAGWSPEEVAQARRLTPKMVRGIRGKAQLGTEDGKPLLPVVTPAAAERAQRARELRGRGLSFRQIAMHLGCGVATVKRDLSEATVE